MAVYHVSKDPSASDANTGLDATTNAWATIETHLDSTSGNPKVSPGDTIWIHAGTYAEAVRPGTAGDSWITGTAGNLISVKAWGSTPTTTRRVSGGTDAVMIQAPTSTSTMTFNTRDCGYYYFEGIIFDGSNNTKESIGVIDTNNDLNNTTWRNCVVRNGSWSGFSMSASSGDAANTDDMNNLIQYCKIHNNGNLQPSVVIGTDALEYQCKTTHTATADRRPITGGSWSSYWVQQNNTGEAGVTWVNGTKYIRSPGAHGIYCHTRGNIFEYNEIHDNRNSGVQIREGTDGPRFARNNIVRYNVIHHQDAEFTEQQTGINLHTYARENIVYRNLIYANLNAAITGTSGDGSSDNLIYGNTIVNNGIGLELVAQALDWLVTNNIIYDNDTDISDLSTSTVYTTNLQTDPSFTDYVADTTWDLTILTGSAARNTGTTLGSPFNAPPYNVDYAGITVPQESLLDIGAYEFFGGLPIQGSDEFSIPLLSINRLIGPPNETILKSNIGRSERYKRGRLQKIYWHHDLSQDLSATAIPFVTIEVSADDFSTIESTHTSVPNVEGWNSIDLWFNTLSSNYRVRISDPTRAEVLSIGPAVFEVVDEAGVMGSI